NLLLLSDYYFLLNNYNKAEKTILIAVKKHPDSQILNIRLAQFYLQAEMQKKALKTLLKLEENHPDNVRFKLMLADLYLSDMQVSKAENMLEKLKGVLDEGSITDYNLLLAKCCLYKYQISYAVSYLKKVISKEPMLLSARYLLGIAYFAGDQVKLAEKSFVSALILDPHHVDTLVMLSYLHYKNQEYDLSLQYLERILLVEKFNSRALTGKGLCLLEQKLFDEAASIFSNVFNIEESLSALYFYGLSIERGGGQEKAAEIFEKVLAADPILIDVLKRYASLLFKLGHTDKAVELAESILKQHSDKPALQYIAADIYFTLEKHEISQNILITLIKENNTHGNVYSLLAKSYRQTGNVDKAIDFLKTCTVRNPDYGQGWIDLANIYLKQEEKKLALDTLRSAYKNSSDSPLIAGNLAWLLIENSTDLNMALDLSRKAYEKDPENAAIADTLAWAYYHKGAYSQAKWLLERAEKLAPEKGIVKYHKAMLLYKLGKTSQASKSFKNALQYSLSDSIIDRIHKILATLETE
ncbi:MAG: tetratricopeptide repeat protein, partial [Desulfobacteraceae bacterium]|nr:tetratricopeptide repeat protein [Desulfobacteraceae bacterium]